MLERFTERARRVIILAQEEAKRLDHSAVGTEHFLLGHTEGAWPRQRDFLRSCAGRIPMKMILAIVQPGDSKRALEALVTEHFQVTKLYSTGGFLRKGNVTLLMGVEDSQVGDVLAVLQRVCPPHENLPVGRGAQSGGAIVFVLNIHRMVKIDAGSNAQAKAS